MGLFSIQKQRWSETLCDCLMVALYASFVIFSSDSTGVIVMVGIVIGICIIKLFNGTMTLNMHIGMLHGYMFLLAMFCILSSFWAMNADYAIEKGITIFELLICISLLYAAYYNAGIERLLKIIMWSGFVVALYTIVFVGLDTLKTTINADIRLENSFANVNAIGMLCAKSVIIATFFNQKRRSWLQLIFCIPTIIIVAASGSRKAFIMLVIGVILIYLLGNKRYPIAARSNKKGKIIKRAIVIIIAILAVGLTGIFDGTLIRLQYMIDNITGNGVIDSSAGLRAYYRTLGWEQFAKTPFLGIGMGNARILALAKTGHDCYLHSNYAELAANGGVVGLIIYYWIYIPIIRREWKLRKNDTYAGILLLLVAINLIMDYGAVTYYGKSTYFFLMIVMIQLSHSKLSMQVLTNRRLFIGKNKPLRRGIR